MRGSVRGRYAVACASPADIDAVEDSVSLGRLMEVFRESGHSRMPVYRDGLDDPRGMVHIKDLMAHICARSTPGCEPATSNTEQELEADGLLATCIQHEMDHLEGVLFIDHLTSLRRNMILRKLQKAKKLKAADAE